MSKNEQQQIPNIVRDYIVNMFNDNLKTHIRDNYKDNLIYIRDICDEAIKKYDKEHTKIFSRK